IANAAVFVSDFLIRTVVLTDDRQRSVRGEFDIIAAAEQQVAELSHLVGERRAVEMTEPCDECIAHTIGDIPANVGVADLVHLAPQNEREIAVVVAKLPQSFFSDLINMVRPTAPLPDKLPGNASQSLQAGQTLTNGCRRDSHARANLLHGPRTEAMQLVEKLPIRLFKYRSHNGLRRRLGKAGRNYSSGLS